MAAEAGWYADPADSAWVRWWDGTAWSSDAQLADSAPEPAPVTVTVPEPPAPVPTPAPPAPPLPVPVPAPLPVPVPAPLPVPVPLPVPEPLPVPVPLPGPGPTPAPPAPLPTPAPAPAPPAPLPTPAPAPAPTPVVVPVVEVARVAAVAPVRVAASPPQVEIPLLAPTTVRAPVPVLAPGAVHAVEPVLVAAGGIPTLEPPPVHHRPPPSVSAPIVTTHPRPGEVGLDTDLAASAASTFHPELTRDTHHTTLPSPPASAYASSGWDSAVATGSGVSRPSSASSFSGVASFEAVGSAVVVGSGGSRRTKVVVGLVVLAILIGVGVVVGLPKYRDLKAAETAVATAPLLVRTAPKSLAGQKAVSVPGLNPGAAAAGATAAGAGWAWAATYGTRADSTYYLVGELPPDARAAAVLAQTDPAALTRLMSELGSGIALGAASTAVISAATEYGTGIGGKTWCMPVEVSGSGGGYCLWTNGREFLQVLNAPNITAMSAKHAVAALKALAASPGPVPAT